MTFLLRYTFTMDDGEVVHDESVIADVSVVEAITKDVWILGERGTLRIAFDPPLVASSPVVSEMT